MPKLGKTVFSLCGFPSGPRLAKPRIMMAPSIEVFYIRDKAKLSKLGPKKTKEENLSNLINIVLVGIEVQIATVSRPSQVV